MHDSEHQLCELKAIGSCLVPVSPTLTAWTLCRSLITKVLSTAVVIQQPFRQAGFAVAPGILIMVLHVCVKYTGQKNAATVTPQPMELQWAPGPALIDLTAVVHSLRCKARSLPWPWGVICKETLYLGFEAFDKSITHSKAWRNKTGTLCETSNRAEPDRYVRTRRAINREAFLF